MASSRKTRGGGDIPTDLRMKVGLFCISSLYFNFPYFLIEISNEFEIPTKST
jgi:hypothetical protein